MRITRLLLSAIVASVVLLTASCDKVDNHRLPPANVNILFNTIGDWQLYGVSGAGQTRDFIRQESQPAGYPYKAGEYTGFGGVMLVCDPNGEYLAFDLACPVEKKADIRVKYDTESTIAGIVKCPECGSLLVEKRKKDGLYHRCSNRDCNYSVKVMEADAGENNGQ